MDYKTPGKRMKARREELHLTQQEAAERVVLLLRQNEPDKNHNFTQETWHRYESDKVVKYPHNIMAYIAQVLDISEDYLRDSLDPFSHIPREIREWLETKESLPYVQEAYFEYKRQEWKGGK